MLLAHAVMRKKHCRDHAYRMALNSIGREHDFLLGAHGRAGGTQCLDGTCLAQSCNRTDHSQEEVKTAEPYEETQHPPTAAPRCCMMP